MTALCVRAAAALVIFLCVATSPLARASGTTGSAPAQTSTTRHEIGNAAQSSAPVTPSPALGTTGPPAPVTPEVSSLSSVFSQLLSGERPFQAQVLYWSKRGGVEQSAEVILGPFTDLAGRVAGELYGALLPSSDNSLHWVFLLITLTIAVTLFVLRGGRGAKDASGRLVEASSEVGLREYLLPRSIYGHPSARVDIGLYLIDRALMPVWTLLFLGALAPFVERGTIHVLESVLGASPHLTVNFAWRCAYGLVTLLLVDLSFFLYHLMMHRTRLGWAIHKVHHSAEVLTPLTRMREHFLEAPIDASFESVGFGVAGGLFAWLFHGGITNITVLNLGLFFFFYELTGNFRHYHISLRYPRWLERWLQSPGMHHTHHSRLPQHWDTNLGLVTSIWDRLAGTLYMAAPDEETPWGLPPADQAQCRTLTQNLAAPFREMFAMARGAAQRLDR